MRKSLYPGKTTTPTSILLTPKHVARLARLKMLTGYSYGDLVCFALDALASEAFPRREGHQPRGETRTLAVAQETPV